MGIDKTLHRLWISTNPDWHYECNFKVVALSSLPDRLASLHFYLGGKHPEKLGLKE
jgi:hypothetical protein